MIKAIILEDEAIASRRLKRMLKDMYGSAIEVIETFQSVADLAEYLLNNNHPDILFQDIMVADGNSFDLYDLLEINSKVIFITAYDEFAITAMRNNAVDYLLKPINRSELSAAIDRASNMSLEDISMVRKKISQYKERFLIRFGNKLHSFRTKEIAYVYSEDKLSFFILKNGIRIPSDLRLQHVEESVDPTYFFRANRQFIVHIEAIDKMLRFSRSRINLKLIPEFPDNIIISTDNTSKFKKWMDR